MHRTQGLTRRILLRWAVASLAVAGLMPGCGSEGVQTSKAEPPESKAGGAIVSKAKLPKLPKNVNPNASNRGIKKEYAD
jgi:hypothetical protein